MTTALLIWSTVDNVDDLDEALSSKAMMSHEEIVQRFKRVFGREMTPSEREVFFLPDESKSRNEMP